MKRVALYCRVSSDDQKEKGTIENQRETLRAYIEMKENLKVTVEYLDDGISGTIPLKERPEGAKLIKDASKGLFDVVLVWKVDRLGRDTLNGLIAVEELRNYNVEIMSVCEPFDLNTPQGRFNFNIYLNLAELERSTILDRMYLGATRQAKNGKYMGGVIPYGYRVDDDGYFVINAEEAAIVKKIFDLYTEEKMSSPDICVYLNELNIPTTKNSTQKGRGVTGKWWPSVVAKMLQNEMYTGVHYYGKRGTRRKELIERKVPGFISKEQFDKADVIRKANVELSFRNTKNRTYLLSKLVYCKRCGYRFGGISYKDRSTVYSCRGKSADKKKIHNFKCDAKNIKADELEEIIWAHCLYILNNYAKLIEDYREKSVSETQDTNDIVKIKNSISNKKIEKNNILSLYRKGIIDEEELQTQISEIKKEEKVLSDLLKSLEDKCSILNKENEMIDATKNKLEFYKNRIDTLTDTDKLNIVRLLVKRVDIDYEISGGETNFLIYPTYNLVKFDYDTLQSDDSKFDISLVASTKPEYDVETVGSLLKTLRLNNKLSQAELAKIFKVNYRTISNLETNKIKKINKYLLKYQEYFNIDIHEYIKEEQ